MSEGIQILHVDDEPDYADMATTFLEREDDRFEAVTATSASNGLEKIAAGDFDCIVSDYEMPGKNGMEFLESVREQNNDLPFILYTGKGSEEIASEAISTGVTDYLQKQSGTEHYTLLANRVANAVEQYRAEKAIGRTRRRFQMLVEETTDVTLIVDPDGTISYATLSAESILGRTPDELVGSNGFAPIHPEDRDRAAAELAALVEQPNQRRTVEFRYRRPDDSWIWVEARGRNLIDEPVISGLVVYMHDVTERKERELELQRKERRYQAIFNDPNILVGLIDTDGIVLDINETAMEYIDATNDDVTGVPFWETPWFSHSETVQQEVKDWIDLATSGEYVEFEVDLIRPDGQPYTVEGVFRPVTNDGGEVVSLIISDREVTERKERERELQRIRDFFTEAERLGNLGAWEFYANGETVWTEGTRRIHEVDEDFDPTVEDGLEFYHPDDRETVQRAVQRALESGDSYDVEARLTTAEGNEQWIRTRGSSINGPETERTIRGFIQDITKVKEREQELRQAKSQLEAAIEAGAVRTWEWQIPSNTLVTDPEFAKTFGVDPDAAREGVPLDKFTSSIHEADRERIEQQIEASVEECSDYEAEYRVWDADEELRWVVARGHVECDEDGNPVSFPGALTDITERKEYERRLEQQNDRLEQFASVVSHDLRNPLQVAEGRLEIAREDCDSEHLDVIERAHERMEVLITDLLTLAQNGETVTKSSSVDLADHVEACWQNVQTKDANLVKDTDLTIRADESRLRQLFENLIRNSVDHGGSGVTVTIGELDDGFYIEDDGFGIPPENRVDAFESGYSTSEQGTGFGLSIVKRVAEAHDWEIRITESSESGVRFEITRVMFTPE